MAMILDMENNILKFEVPNSEAEIKAQHFGIKNRTVGSYYMSDKFDECISFFNNFIGDFYIDISLCIQNAKFILNILSEKKLNNLFKSNLEIQNNAIATLEWYINNENNFFYKIIPPQINEQKKYLKLDNEDEIFRLVKLLILGDLTCLCFKKLGINGFIIYIDKINNFSNLIESDTIFNWIK